MDLRMIKNEIQKSNDQLLKIGEVAKLLSVSTMTLRRWDKIGILKAIRLHLRSKRFYKKFDVMNFISREETISNQAANLPTHHIISLKQFGNILVHAKDGKKAWKFFEPTLRKMAPYDTIDIDFAQIENFLDDWAEEFLRPLHKMYGEKMTLKNIEKLGFISVLELMNIYRSPRDRLLYGD